MKEITQRGDIILFIDELHNLVGAGAAEGAIDAASILKPALARGELRTIGATTLDEYRKYLERDAALERRFQQIRVDEPSVGRHRPDPARPPRPLRGPPPLHDHGRRAPRLGRARRPLHPGPPPAGQGHRPDRRGRVPHAHQDDDRPAALPRARGRDREGARGEGGDRGAGVREGREPARQGAQAHAEEARARGQAARRSRSSSPRSARRRSPTSSRCGRASRLQADGGGVAEAHPHGGRAAQARDRPARGDHRRLQVDPARARRDQGPKPPDRLVHLPRPLGRGEDRAGAHPRRVPLRRRGRDDPGGHVGVHGEALRVPARRLAPGYIGYDEGRTRPCAASRTPSSSSTRSKGPPGRLQHPPADPRGREADGRPGGARSTSATRS